MELLLLSFDEKLSCELFVSIVSFFLKSLFFLFEFAFEFFLELFFLEFKVSLNSFSSGMLLIEFAVSMSNLFIRF